MRTTTLRFVMALLVPASALAALLYPGPADAQYRDYGRPGVGAGLRVGGVLGSTELSDDVDFQARAYLSEGLTEHFSAQLGAGYAALSGSDYRSDVGLVDARLLLTPFQFPRWSPYAYIGGGALRYDLDRIPASRAADIDPIGWAAFVPAGFGVMLKVTERVSLDLGAGYAFTSSDALNGTGIRSGNDMLWGLKVGLDLGRHPDPDRDGLYWKAERRAGTDPRRSDSDGDGLADGAELRLHRTDPLKSDTDGDRLSDGDEVRRYRTSPLAFDSDGDGLNDSAEIDLGTDPLVADTDGDGITDGAEMAAGTDPRLADAPQAAAGVTSEAMVAAARTGSITLSDVAFGHAQAQLTPEAKKALDQVASYLRANPNATLEVRGHSNDPREVGRRLSQSRAEAAAAFLAGQGIPATRLVARGLGATDLLAPPTTEANRQMNRRVQLLVME